MKLTENLKNRLRNLDATFIQEEREYIDPSKIQLPYWYLDAKDFHDFQIREIRKVVLSLEK